MNDGPIERTCYWLDRRQQPPFTALEGQQRAQVAVIGAGLTGLWTALFLHELDPGLDICVVERGCAAHGASGRNAGMLSETVDHSHELAVAHFGEEEARLLAQLGRDNVTQLLSFLQTNEIDCDYEPVGRLVVALDGAQLEALHADRTTAASLGIKDYVLLDRTETQAELASPGYLGGLFVPTGGILDPVKLVDGLRRVALARGIRIYEQSEVTSLREDGPGMRLTTARGSLDAGRVILGTSAYTHQLLPGTRWRFIPLYDYIIVSEPLSQEQLASIGWRRRQGVTDGRNFFLYYRLTKDDRIVWGTSEAVYYSPNRVGPELDHSAAHYAALERDFHTHFPQLGAVRFEYRWGGPICATTRMTPFFGSAFGGKAWYGLGFTGHGLGTTRLAGKILAHLGLSRADDLLSLRLVTDQPLPYPPEPFRRWAVSRVTRDLRRVDLGHPPSLLLRMLEKLGVGFSS